MRVFPFLQRLGIGLAIIILSIIGIPLFQFTLGYHFEPGWEVARRLIAIGEDVQECEKVTVVPWNIIGPTAPQQRGMCIYEYAKLTKDPSACELLMPSSYGLACVGGAEKSESCKMRDGYVASDDGSITYKDCRLSDPSRTKLQNDCCLIARVTFVKSENDCSSLQSNKDLYEECISNMSFKNHDPLACAIIENENRRAACTVRAAAILKDPSICKGCKKPVESLSDLQ